MLAPFLDSVRLRVNARLAEVLGQMATWTREQAPDALPVLQAASNLTLRGGKRLRPALLFAAIECSHPGAPPGAATDAGAALELLQSYFLIHDDWMDGDTMRRGGPAVHVALTEVAGHEHGGASAAILAGDLIASLAHEVVATIDLPPGRHREVLRLFSRMEHEVILGQCLDLLHATDIERTERLKTGSYTVRGPLQIGSAIVDAPDPVRRALERFAEPLGVAFQLRDDLLGAFGTAEQIGKSVGGDFREGKQTVLIRHALTHLPPASRDELECVLGRRSATDEQVARARDLVEQSGARAAAEALISKRFEECLAALDEPAIAPGGRALLAALARSMTHRKQ